MLKILSWNVNGIRAAGKKGFVDWLTKESPDIVCVQESKAMQEQAPKNIVSPPGYKTIWHSAERKGYSGTVTFHKQGLEPLSIDNMGVDDFDIEGRVQLLQYPKFYLINAYYPNSRPERARLGYKLDFNAAMLKLCRKLQKKLPVVVCGDYNVAHNPIDLARPKQNENNPGYYIEEREAMSKFIDSGFVDTFRHYNDEAEHYSWWSYRARARERNVGWRIDYFCASKKLMPRIKQAFIMPDVMGSDHCPVGIDIEEK